MEPKCTVAWLIACWPHESQQVLNDIVKNKITQSSYHA